MSTKLQIIYEQGKPAFAVIPYEEYLALTNNCEESARDDDEEYVPFILSDYINNPVRVARIKAGVTQKDLAACLAVTQGYVSKIEGHNYEVSDNLLKRVKIALSEHNE
ncbi:MAG: helix-turn-helix transcriptional regulator [Sulfurimicrobium sp.]|jgi:ribosome-binding protein aMBF1 (putative translation factor)|nr:helix-turn-helix transcriptional regulator [Pseudohongiella sp.]MDP2962997.1 helix-turn-helix transcriptional regulator [Sulfurimicrobium sp.]